jgi:glycosyltransferase involved in cell wall biosynthesis
MLLEIYTIVAVLYWVVLALYLCINGKKIKYLSTIKIDANKTPSVVIIIAVRNEEDKLKEALTSLCKLNYSNYRILVVNDRSTDSSGKILEELQTEYDKFTVINIDKLPKGWLGKNYALYSGYQQSKEEYLLFTDADVVFTKDVLSKAISFSLNHNLDHLTILPEIISSSPILKSVITTFIIMLTALQRPWAAKIKTSKASMGVGAFNLVKRHAYVRAGTHKAIAMRPDDDLRLAAYIKASGGAADVLYGQNELRVEWYKSIKELINGLMKNTFSGFDYNIIKVIGGVVGTLIFFVFPIPIILIFGNAEQRMLLICMFLFQVILYWKMPGSKGKWWFAFMSMYGGMIIVYIMIKSTIITVRNGGIYWRETFYPLTALRQAPKNFDSELNQKLI